MKGKIANALVHVAISSTLRHDFLGCVVNIRRLSKRSCGSGSLACRFAGNRLHNQNSCRPRSEKQFSPELGKQQVQQRTVDQPRPKQKVEARVTRVARRSAKGTGRASHEWNGRQGKGSESRQERRHNYRRSWNRPTCRWLNNIHCWCWDSGTPPIALEVTDVAGENDVLARSAAIAACTDWAIKATISGDQETPEDEPARAEAADSPTSVDWGTGAATEKQLTRQTATGNYYWSNAKSW